MEEWEIIQKKKEVNCWNQKENKLALLWGAKKSSLQLLLLSFRQQSSLYFDKISSPKYILTSASHMNIKIIKKLEVFLTLIVSPITRKILTISTYYRKRKKKRKKDAETIHAIKNNILILNWTNKYWILMQK